MRYGIVALLRYNTVSLTLILLKRVQIIVYIGSYCFTGDDLIG